MSGREKEKKVDTKQQFEERERESSITIIAFVCSVGGKDFWDLETERHQSKRHKEKNKV
jgi:hypothetical protein